MGKRVSECQNEIFRRAKQMVKERQDITGLNCIKGASGKVIVDDKGIKDCWKELIYIILVQFWDPQSGCSATVCIILQNFNLA